MLTTFQDFHLDRGLGNPPMTDEPLERCICTGLAGFVFEDRPAGGRRVAIGCVNCGTRTNGFPLNQIEDAILAWDAGDFADNPSDACGETSVTQPGRHGLRQPRHFAPSKFGS